MSRDAGAPEEPPEEATTPRAKRFARRDRADEPELSEAELERLEGEALPYREAMSVLDANVSIPLNPAIAADVLAGEPDAGAEPGEEAEPDPGR